MRYQNHTTKKAKKKARLLLNRARDLIIHDQDGHFFFNHSGRGDYPAA